MELNPGLTQLGAARDYFWPNGAGRYRRIVVKQNPELAATLRAIAEQGADALHVGPIAEAIVAGLAVQNSEVQPGLLTMEEHLANYQPHLARASVRARIVSMKFVAWVRRAQVAVHDVADLWRYSSRLSLQGFGSKR